MERLSFSEKVFKTIAYILVGVFAMAALYPFIYALAASLSGRAEFEQGLVVLFPVNPTAEVYQMLFNTTLFWVSYANTLFYTVFGVMWSMLISTTGAYALSKRRLLFRRQFNFYVVFTMWFSAGMIPNFLNYTNMGVDNRWGMIVAFGVQAFNIILLRNYFEGVPSEIEEAARIDGASEIQLFTKIYLPMSKAALATITLFYATSRWNGFFWSQILLMNNNDQPLQVYLISQLAEFRTVLDNLPNTDLLTFSPDSYAYAILVLSIIPIIIVYPFIQKFFAKGVNMGGVKG